MSPLLQALRDLGGSGSVEEIYEKVAENLEFGEDVLDFPHNPEKSNQTELQYRLAWARTSPAERPIRQPAIGSAVVCHLIWTYILSE